MGVVKRVIGAGALVGGLLLGAAGLGSSAEAGEVSATGDLRVYVNVTGLRAADVLTMTPELYQGGSKLFDCDTPNPSPTVNGVFGSTYYDCTVATGTYQLGIDGGLDAAGYARTANCFAPPGEQFVDPTVDVTIEPFGRTDCFITYETTVLILDKQVSDSLEFGPETLASASDFELEVWNAGGGIFATGSDPSDDTCATFGPYDDCYTVDLPDGDYVLGEVPVPGYFGVVVECSEGSLDERFTGPNAEITAEVQPDGSYIYCLIRNTYGEGEVTVNNTVVNDDGGTAAVTDFTAELYDSSMALVDSAVCPASGPCLEGSYPIDDYTVGMSGPDGYTYSATQSILLPTEPLDDPDASFTLDTFGDATIDVISNDSPTTTTTTTTTTTVAPTTVAPTTAAPTTQAPTTVQQTTTTLFGAGAGTLPATGQPEGSNTVLLLAVGFILLGGFATWLSRRRS